VAVAGNVAFVVETDGHLWAVDVSNPAAPATLDFMTVSEQLEGIALQGSTACIVDAYTGVHLIDVSDPTQLTRVASLFTRGSTQDIAVSGEIAYASGAYPGLSLVDLSDCGPPPCPADPSDLLASEPLKGVANLTWTDNAYNEAGFRVQREQFLQGVWKNGTIVATLPANTFTFAQSPGQGFWRYQVQAFTAGCDSAWTGFKSVPAAAPGGLTVTKVNGAARLDWTDNSSFESKFLVQRQQKVGNLWKNQTNVGNPTKNAVTFTNAPGAGTWRYRLRANSPAGNSAFTPWKTITLP
jgi:hypothetical protein